MSAFLDSLRADLLDKRLRPLLALLALGLAGAIVYAVMAGSGSSTPTAASSPAPGGRSTGVAVSVVKPEAAQAVAETTSGASQQTGGGRTRNPFAPLPGSAARKASTTPASSKSSPSSAAPSSGSSSSAGSGSTSAGSGSGSSSGSGSVSPSGGATPSKPKRESPQTVYQVSVLFGAAAPGTPLASAQLTPYDELMRQQPLPSAQQALVVFRGVIAGGKSATFTLVGEAILRGVAVCRPSASQCQTIDLQIGQTEELEYAPPGGTATTYMLHIVAIKAVKAKAAAARRAFAGQSKAGLRLLRSSGLAALPGLRYSGAKGVLVFAGRKAFAARARIAKHRAHAPQR
ncbi:MAG TPA: hypothetical protein VK707_04085 [Solirubrobacteraceae bacterium]|jgi:hypothetical protein|nr:hypothetical protein [Solirubrobacteraceae bacterium]